MLHWISGFHKPWSVLVSLLLSSHLRLGLPKTLFPTGLPANILKALHLLPFWQHEMSNLNLLDLIILTILGEAGHVARMEEGRSAFKILKGKPTGKRPLGRPRRRWEDRIGLEEIGINAGNWIDSAQDRHYWRALVIEPPGSTGHGVS